MPHHLSVAEAVELGRLPERLQIYAIEGRDFTAGSGLTADVERAVEQVAVELRERLARAP
jgi:hydrogenase maturation protease